MSYTTPPPSGYVVPGPAQPAKPGTVSIASFLLYLLGLLSLVSAVLSIYTATLMTAEKVAKIYRDAGMSGADADTAASFASVSGYIGAAISVIVAILYIVSAIFVGQGKQWARILAWVIAGLGICCGILGLASQAASSALSGIGSQPGVDNDKVMKGLTDLEPSWLTPLSLTLGVISLLAAIGVVVLLALPPSHPYFRKTEPVWTPPPSYPGA